MKKLNQRIVMIIVFILIIMSCMGLGVLLNEYVTPKYNIKDTLSESESKKFNAYIIEEGKKKELTWGGISYYQGISKAYETVYLSRNIDEMVEGVKLSGMGNPILEMELQGCKASIFLDDQLIYTDDASIDNRIGYVQFDFIEETINSRTIYISLPEDYYGKTLTIASACSSYFEDGAVWTPMVWIADIAGYMGEQVAIGGGQIYKISFYTAMLLIILILLAYSFYNGERKGSLIVLGLYFLTCILKVTLSMDNAIGYYCKGMIDNEYIMMLVVNGSQFLIILYIVLQSKKWKIPMRIYYGISVIVYTLLMWMSVKGFAFEAVDKFMNFLVFALVFVLICNIFVEWKCEKNSLYHKIMGMFLIAVIPITAVLYIISMCIKGNIHIWLNGLFLSVNEYGFYFLNYNLLILLSIICFITIVMTQIKNVIQKNTDYQLLRVRSEIEYASYNQMQDYVTNTNMIMHDIRNHIFELAQLLKSSEYEKAQNYVNDLIIEEKEIPPIVQTNNKVVNDVLNSRISIAHRKDVNIEIENLSLKSDLNMSEVDICSLFTNIMDNAICACEELNEKEKTIVLDIHERNNFVYISIQNPVEKKLTIRKEDGLVETTKVQANGHGYGLSIVQRIVDKYQGLVNISTEKEAFYIEIALPL